MTGRSEPVKGYVEPRTKKKLEQQANQNGMTISSLVNQYIERGLREDLKGEAVEERDIEQSLVAAVDDALDEYRDIAQQLIDIQQHSARYSIVNYLLLKQSSGLPESQISKEWQTSQRRLHNTPPELDRDRDQEDSQRVEETDDQDDEAEPEPW